MKIVDENYKMSETEKDSCFFVPSFHGHKMLIKPGDIVEHKLEKQKLLYIGSVRKEIEHNYFIEVYYERLFRDKDLKEHVLDPVELRGVY